MNHEALAGNPEAQQRALSEVAEKVSLTRLLPSVAAYSLGAIPLSRDDDGIALATFPGICSGALGLLRRHLGAPLKPVEFDENVMAFFVDKIYLNGRGVNIHTFKSPDFLDDPRNDERVLALKVEHPEPATAELNPGKIVLLDVHLASALSDLDDPQPARLEAWRLGEFCPGFRREGDRWTVWSAAPLPADAPLFIQYSEHYSGGEFFRDITGEAVREFPFILFPSEVQILGVRANGTVELYLDGVTHSIAPGQTPVLGTEYWLVRHGHRFHRKLTVGVKGVWLADRGNIDVAPPFRGAGAPELANWLRS